MVTRAWLGILAGGVAVAGVLGPPVLALCGVLAAVTALLAACVFQNESEIRPTWGLVGSWTLTVAVVLLGAFFFKAASPLGFLWLLGPGFVLAAPLFLAFFARSLRKP